MDSVDSRIAPSAHLKKNQQRDKIPKFVKFVSRCTASAKYLWSTDVIQLEAGCVRKEFWKINQEREGGLQSDGMKSSVDHLFKQRQSFGQTKSQASRKGCIVSKK